MHSGYTYIPEYQSHNIFLLIGIGIHNTDGEYDKVAWETGC